MSEQVTAYGILHKVELPEGWSNEDFAKSLFIKNHERVEDSWVAEMEWEYEEDYVIVNGIIYQFEEYQKSNEADFISMTVLPNGDISFITSYYNGGAGLEEMLEEGMEEIHEDSL